jgi:cytochrome c oxidase assembly protein subunit 15
MGSRVNQLAVGTGVHAFAVFTAMWALLVISIGGLVTSKGVGMSVPDWPTTYGYNMFFFPVRLWEGGIFHEHLHRLVASGLGLWTVILAAWITAVRADRPVRLLGWAAVVAVVIQGLLGGKRVLLNSVDVLGIPGSVFFGVLHAMLAQLFFALLCTIALMTGRGWKELVAKVAEAPPGRSWIYLMLVAGVILQLAVAASMRHQHAGLAIPDFPLAYGRVLPPTDPSFLDQVNQRRLGVVDDAPITAFQVWLQMGHRGLAVLLVGLVWFLAFASPHEPRVWRLSIRWLSALFGIQFCLGAATIWSNKAADIATAHVATGASILAGCFVMAFARFSGERQRKKRFQPCPKSSCLLKTPAEPAGGQLV